ncbi:MAG: hypothetical protein AAF127_09825 [Pseudomonadota bacterium]
MGVVFAILALVFALLIWLDRPGAGLGPAQRSLQFLIPSLLLMTALVSAANNGRGERVSVAIDELLISASALDGGDPAEIIVGDRPEFADLVVRPSADRRREFADRSATPRILMKVIARQERGDMTAQYQIASYPPDEQTETPGMGIALRGTRLALDGDEPVRRQGTLALGEALRMTVYRINPGARDPDDWIARRSFTLKREETTLAGARAASEDGNPRESALVRVMLDKPLRASVGSCAPDDEMELRLQPAVASGPDIAAYEAPGNLVYRDLGQGGGSPLLRPSLLGPIAEPDLLCSAPAQEFVWPAAGALEDPRLSARSEADRLPWLALAVTALVSLGLWAGLAGRWEEQPAERLAVSFIMGMLTLRTIIAGAGPYYDGGLNDDAVMAEALLGFVGMPLLASAILRRSGAADAPQDRTGVIEWLALIGFCALAQAAVLARYGTTGDWVTYMLILFPLGALSWRALIASAWGAQRVDDAQSRLRERISGFASGSAQKDRVESAKQAASQADEKVRSLPVLRRMGWPGVGLALVILVRLALVVVGIKERFFLPLSLIYIPLVIVLAAMCLVRLHQPYAGKRGWWEPWVEAAVFGALLFGAVLVAPVVARDSGLFFILGPAIGWVALRYALTRSAKGTPFPARAAAFVALPMMVGLIAGYAVYLVSGEMVPPDAPIMARVQEILAYETNEIRLIQFANPALLDQIGNIYAYRAIEQQELLWELTGSMSGQGWLAPARLYSLRDPQFSDNAAAIHIAWPFGRFALLGVVAMVAAFAAAATPAIAKLRQDWLAVAGIMAGAMLAWSAVYMALANLLLVPFTGRNIYLLSATSGGDLLEGVVLAILTVASLRWGSEHVWRRDAEDGQP